MAGFEISSYGSFHTTYSSLDGSSFPLPDSESIKDVFNRLRIIVQAQSEGWLLAAFSETHLGDFRMIFTHLEPGRILTTYSSDYAQFMEDKKAKDDLSRTQTQKTREKSDAKEGRQKEKRLDKEEASATMKEEKGERLNEKRLDKEEREKAKKSEKGAATVKKDKKGKGSRESTPREHSI
jgi:hypothetical protein